MYRPALDIATKGMDGVPKDATFFKRLEWLRENHKITPDIRSWADHVRVEGKRRAARFRGVRRERCQGSAVPHRDVFCATSSSCTCATTAISLPAQESYGFGRICELKGFPEVWNFECRWPETSELGQK
jgi:hypothetical protein